MVTKIGVSAAGSVFFSGTSSGIDTQALIENAVNAKLLPKKRVDDQISANLKKISAFQALQTQANAFKATIDKLKSDLVLGNVFSLKTPSYSTSDGSAAANLLTASTVFGAQSGSYGVVVDRLAKAQSVASAVQTSATAALNYTGTFDIGIAGKTAATITVSASSTLQDIRNAINATSSTSGVKADILQQASGQFKLIISGTETAKAISVTNITGDNVLNNLGVTDVAGTTFLDPRQAAQQARVYIDGNEVLSDSNQINNVLTGVSLSLVGAAPGTTVTLTIGNNNDGIKTAINNFVSSYNSLKATIAANQKINADGSVDENAVLFGETLNSSLGSNLAATLNRLYGSGTYQTLRSIGITLNASNDLVVDSAALTTALNADYDSVSRVFSTGTSTTGFADEVSTLINKYANTATGEIAKAISAFQTTNTSLTTKAKDIQVQADAYQLRLIDIYAKLESRIKTADTIKKQINAILDGTTKR